MLPIDDPRVTGLLPTCDLRPSFCFSLKENKRIADVGEKQGTEIRRVTFPLLTMSLSTLPDTGV